MKRARRKTAVSSVSNKSPWFARQRQPRGYRFFRTIHAYMVPIRSEDSVIAVTLLIVRKL